jgi:hypothetical protein
MPAVSFVFTSLMPARCLPGKEIELPIPPVRSKAGSNEGLIHSQALLQAIRNWKK